MGIIVVSHTLHNIKGYYFCDGVIKKDFYVCFNCIFYEIVVVIAVVCQRQNRKKFSSCNFRIKPSTFFASFHLTRPTRVCFGRFAFGFNAKIFSQLYLYTIYELYKRTVIPYIHKIVHLLISFHPRGITLSLFSIADHHIQTLSALC